MAEQSRHTTLLRRKGCHWSTKRITGLYFTYRCLLVKAITKFFALSLPKRELFQTCPLRPLDRATGQFRQIRPPTRAGQRCAPVSAAGWRGWARGEEPTGPPGDSP